MPQTVAQILVVECFYKFGVPSRLHSDRCKNFEPLLIHQLCTFNQLTLYNLLDWSQLFF